MDAKRLWKLFNISENERTALWESQDKKCSICKKELDLNSPGAIIEHRHSDGLIRSICCFRCNKALGWFSDDIERLKNAIEYLCNPPAITVLGKRYGRIGRTTNKGPSKIRNIGTIEYRCGCRGRTKTCPVHKQPVSAEQGIA